MYIRSILWIAIASHFAIFNALAFSPARPTGCFPRGEWKTVDAFLPPISTIIDDRSAFPYSAASSSKADYIVGGYFKRDAPAGYRWLVRRSLDQGNTWSTSEEFYVDIGQDTLAVGVTVDRITDEVYVAGSTLWQYEAYLTHGWVVRKSSDHGASWTTADDFMGSSSGEPHIRSITSSLGVIYAGGINVRSLDGSIPHEVILRRSDDSGKSWITVNLSSYLSDITSVTAASNGSVFVTGKRLSPKSNWIVVYSPNGKDSWRVVENFSDGTTIQGSIAAPIANLVEVYGTSHGGNQWVVREANTAFPDRWKTIDAYRPEVIDGKGTAVAGAATFAKPTQPISILGSLYVTGEAKSPLKSGTTYLTRRRINPTSKTFVMSDQYDETYSQGKFTGPWAATTTNSGHILTAHSHPNPAGRVTWVVRKLLCQ